MNILFSFLFILISLLVQILNYEPSDSLFSLLLDKVRKDVVKSSLLNLPERENSNLMEMILLMVKEKINNNLTDIEEAFLIYQWIGENIEINCANNYVEKESTEDIYISGKGSVIGISTLFYMICSIMKIESGYIDGYTKIHSYGYFKYTETQHMWNFILINNTKYLIDASLGSGFCTDYSFTKAYTNLYFGIKPEILIKMNFPKNEEFQMLEKKITKGGWEYLAFRNRYFYLYGLINIEPDNKYLSLKKVDKVTIKYDTSNSDIGIIAQIYYNDNYGAELIFNQVTYKGGIAEISLKNWNKTYYNPIRLEIYAGSKKNPWEKKVVLMNPQS